MKVIRSVLVGASLGLACIAAEATERTGGQSTERQFEFDIESQALTDALNAWAEQTNLQWLGLLENITDQVIAPAVRGSFTPQGALNALLSGTQYTYEFVNERTVAIREKGRQSSADIVPATYTEPAKVIHLAYLTDTDPGITPRTQSADIEPEKSTGRHAEKREQSIDEVVVTGTHIRGVDPAGPLIEFSQQDIAETGYATVQDWLKTLPQNFNSLHNDEQVVQGNFNRGTAINLRGLGAGATLVLVNGRRQPVSGTEADFVDVSSIPTSMIERVEVLTDGASALYGSDAVGGVVNFILKKDFTGAKTAARFGSARGDAGEVLVSQMLGTAWDTGQVMLDFQYYNRSALANADRSITASADKRAYGGSDLRVFHSNPGNVLVGGSPAFAIPENQDGTSLAAEDLLPGVVNLQEPLRGATAVPERQLHSGFLSLSQEMGDSLTFFLEGRYSKREIAYAAPAQAAVLRVTPLNPFFVSPNGGTSTLIAYSYYDDFGNGRAGGETETYVATTGANLQFGAGWAGSLSVTESGEDMQWSAPFVDTVAVNAALVDQNPATAFNPFGDGSHTNPETLSKFLRTQISSGSFGLRTANLTANGPLFSVPGGDVKVAIGADYRAEDFDRYVNFAQTEFERTVGAAFAEMIVPVFSSENSLRGLQLLEISSAGRYEQYNDFGSTFDPKLSVRYKPSDTVLVRTSWGTSFRAPPLGDLEERTTPQNSIILSSLTDPQSSSPSGRSLVLLRQGGNSALREETAQTWTVGVDLDSAPNVNLSITYFHTEYTDRIVRPGPTSPLDVLLLEDLWADIIVRDPSPELIDQLCHDPTFIGSVDACLVSSPAAIVDFRKRNIAQTEVEGLDVLFGKSISTPAGNVGLTFNGTYALKYEYAGSRHAKAADVRNTIGGPLSLKLRATGIWNYRGFGASLALNHLRAYQDAMHRAIDDWNTVDLRVTYTAPSSDSWLGGLELALTAANLADKEPPFVNTVLGYDPANANALGRVLAVQLTKVW